MCTEDPPTFNPVEPTPMFPGLYMQTLKAVNAWIPVNYDVQSIKDMTNKTKQGVMV